MDRLSIISDSIGRAEDVSRQLTGVFETQSIARDRLSGAPPTKHAIVDIDLGDSSHLADLRLWLDYALNHGDGVFARPMTKLPGIHDREGGISGRGAMISTQPCHGA